MITELKLTELDFLQGTGQDERLIFFWKEANVRSGLRAVWGLFATNKLSDAELRSGGTQQAEVGAKQQTTDA